MPLTEPDDRISRIRLFSCASLTSSKRIKVVKDSRLWKRIPTKEAFKLLPGKAFPLTSAVEPFEGHHLRLKVEGLHFPHVAADAEVVVVSPELSSKHRPPVPQLGNIANGFQPPICRCKLGSKFLRACLASKLKEAFPGLVAIMRKAQKIKGLYLAASLLVFLPRRSSKLKHPRFLLRDS